LEHDFSSRYATIEYPASRVVGNVRARISTTVTGGMSRSLPFGLKAFKARAAARPPLEF